MAEQAFEVSFKMQQSPTIATYTYSYLFDRFSAIVELDFFPFFVSSLIYKNLCFFGVYCRRTPLYIKDVRLRSVDGKTYHW